MERGATKVYAGARHPGAVRTPGVIQLQLDVTSAADIAAAIALCSDTAPLVNNAGILAGASALSADALERGRREIEANLFGPLAMSAALAPVLAANGGGAIINVLSVLSVLSWVASPGAALYCASKAAAWSLTNALRLELIPQRTQVMALHVGYMDTDMAAEMNAPKSSVNNVRKVIHRNA